MNSLKRMHYASVLCMCLNLPQLLKYLQASVPPKYKGQREATVFTFRTKTSFWFCFLASLSIPVSLSVFLQSFIIRIIIYYTVRVSVSKLLACTQPITLLRQNTREGFHEQKENLILLNFVSVSSLPLNRILSPVCPNASGCSGLSGLSFIFHGCVCCWHSLMFAFHGRHFSV